MLLPVHHPHCLRAATLSGVAQETAAVTDSPGPLKGGGRGVAVFFAVHDVLGTIVDVKATAPVRTAGK